MRFRRFISCLTAFCLALLIAGHADAQNRLAYVIGNGTSADGYSKQPAKDALAVSRKLLGLGFDVIRREDVSPAALPMGRTAADTVVLYYAGRTTAQDGRTLIMGNRDTGWPVLDTAKAFQRSGASQVLVFIENCHTGVSDLAPLPPDRSSWRGIFLTTSASPIGECSTVDGTSFTDRVLAALSAPDIDVAEAFTASKGAGWAVSNLTEPLVLLKSGGDALVLSDADLALLERLAPTDRDRMRALWERAGFLTAANAQPAAPLHQPVRIIQNDTISFSNRVEPVQLGAVLAPQTPSNGSLTPASLPSATDTGTIQGSGIQIINSAPRSQVAALPAADGLPRPSVIVGRILAEDAAFEPTVAGGTLNGTQIDTAGFEAREAIRVDDATLYAQLVNSGAFDPGTAPRELERALQIELDRMGCYTSTIDGIWGGNSALAVDRYYQQIGETPDSREPSIALFRKIVLRNDVRCPVVRQAARPAPTTPRATTGRANQPRATQPRAAQPRAAQPAAPSGQQIQIRPNIFGTGIRG